MTLEELLALAASLLHALGALGVAVLRGLVAWTRENPRDAFIVFLGVAVLMGTVIQTGTRGVLFRMGRVRRVLEPGFHFLIPWLDQVKKLHTRALTLDVPAQRATTRDGMVYDVDANVVYRIADPVRASVDIDDYRRGVLTRTALAVQELLRQSDRNAVREREDLDQRLTELLAPRLAAWGLTLERAGFTSIAPAGPTVHVTQLRSLAREREQAWAILREGGLAPRTALALLGADRRLVSKGHARYLRAQAEARAKARARALEEKARAAKPAPAPGEPAAEGEPSPPASPGAT